MEGREDLSLQAVLHLEEVHLALEILKTGKFVV